MRRFEIRLPRYGSKSLFFGYEIRFKALAVLFLEHWRFFASSRCTVATILVKKFINMP